MSLSHCLLLVVFIVCEGFPQTHSNDSSRPRFTEKEIKEVLHEANGVPAEFGADIRLTIVESGSVEPQMRQALLIEAYSLAGDAQEPVALRRVEGGGPITGALNDVFQRGLDTVSLQARVSEASLTDNVDRAQDLFRRIVLRPNVRSACEQQMVYDPSRYYSAMAHVVASLPIGQARARFLEDQIPQLVSAAQVALFIQVISDSKASSANLTTIAQSTAAQLSEIPSDPRVFSSAYNEAIPALMKLASSLSKPEQESFLIQVRKWILKSVNNGMCQLRGSRVRNRDGSIYHYLPPNPGDLFNQQLKILGREDLDIEPSDVSARPMGPPAAKDDYSSDYLSMFRAYRVLANDYITANTTGQWQSDLHKYLDTFVQWNVGFNSNEYPAFYIEKANILQLVLGIQERATTATAQTPQSEYATRGVTSSQTSADGDKAALQALLALIDSAPGRAVYSNQHLLWFHPVQELLRSPYNGEEVDAKFKASSNPVLRSYGALSHLLHPGPVTTTQGAEHSNCLSGLLAKK